MMQNTIVIFAAHVKQTQMKTTIRQEGIFLIIEEFANIKLFSTLDLMLCFLREKTALTEHEIEELITDHEISAACDGTNYVWDLVQVDE